MKQLFLVFMLAFSGAWGDPAEARLLSLTEDEMAHVTGQFGFSIPAGETVKLYLSMDTFYYHDDDGTGNSSQGGYLSLCGLHLDGSISVGSAAHVQYGPLRSFVDGSQVSGLSILIDDMTIRIDHFAIDAIRVGSAPGEGPSFGAIGMQNFVMHLSGKMQIYIH
ncbi:MAG: hypothetical protein C4519_06740 [Desulfobacteraceae bacterium]|nr:MAG: hypothetical protein C4519_06740 [Desulfobacteraceae bacterium]